MITPLAATAETADGVEIDEVPAILPRAQRLHILAYCGALLLLFNLAAPYAGLIVGAYLAPEGVAAPARSTVEVSCVCPKTF